MYGMEDLFDRRSIVGIKLENILEERGYTKVEICKKSGVSRPTLDKILAGTLTNKTNYEKHLSKILEYLGIAPSLLLGRGRNECNCVRELRNRMNIASEEIAREANISLIRLKEIEMGESATLAELRDIAMTLSVSVSCLQGKNFFEPQVARLDMLLQEDEKSVFSGFWGHIGIQICNSDGFIWFPITGNTRKYIYGMKNNSRIVVPCMNNKVLLLNMENIKEIILLDDACDQPAFVEWDYEVSCGEIPLVVYEALEDYDDIFEEDELLSEKMKRFLSAFIEKKKWSSSEIYDVTRLSKIYYTDGTERLIAIDFQQEESVSEEITNIYVFEDNEFLDNMLFCQDDNGAEVLINMKQVSILELPLLKVEGALHEKLEKLHED